MADTSVKCITSAMTGGGYTVPVLSGTIGAMVNILDYALVTGGSTQPVDSIVIAGNIATVTCAAGHPFEAGSCTNIAGATVTGGSINGNQRVIDVTTTTYTFEVALANQSATGTILHNVPPLGWSIPFTGANLRAYRSVNPLSPQYYLKVVDTAATDTKVYGLETMTSINDVNTAPFNAFPTSTQALTGLFWTKSTTASSAARNWAIIGDDRAFVIWVEHFIVGSPGSFGCVSYLFGFGDLTPVRSTPGPYDCYITGSTSSITGSQTADLSSMYVSDTNLYTARNALGNVISANSSSPTFLVRRTSYFDGQSSTAAAIYSGMGLYLYPDSSDGILISPIQLTEGAGTSLNLVLRGFVPGVMFCLNLVGNTQFYGIPSVLNFSTNGLRRYKVLNQLVSTGGPIFIDMTGPWR